MIREAERSGPAGNHSWTSLLLLAGGYAVALIAMLSAEIDLLYASIRDNELAPHRSLSGVALG
jgi:hypothetical protein